MGWERANKGQELRGWVVGNGEEVRGAKRWEIEKVKLWDVRRSEMMGVMGR